MTRAHVSNRMGVKFEPANKRKIITWHSTDSQKKKSGTEFFKYFTIECDVEYFANWKSKWTFARIEFASIFVGFLTQHIHCDKNFSAPVWMYHGQFLQNCEGKNKYVSTGSISKNRFKKYIRRKMGKKEICICISQKYMLRLTSKKLFPFCLFIMPIWKNTRKCEQKIIDKSGGKLTHHLETCFESLV